MIKRHSLGMSFSIEGIKMKKEIVFQYVKVLEKLKDEEYLKAVVSYNVAPVVAGKKPASILSLGSGGRNLKLLWKQYFCNLQTKSDIEWVQLRENENSTIVMIYNRSMLKELLGREDIRSFFRVCGYRQLDLKALLKDIKYRYRKGCPHEIGVLLGIPLEDVKAFITGDKKPLNKGGYWLVYSEVEKAYRTFALYDSIREKVAMDIIESANRNNY